nr:MAG TPA: hypothetical protein [Caudoviricetes sp.]
MAGEYRRGNLLTLIWDWDKYHDLAMANVDNAVADSTNFEDTNGEYLGDEYVQDWIEEQEQTITKKVDNLSENVEYYIDRESPQHINVEWWFKETIKRSSHYGYVISIDYNMPGVFRSEYHKKETVSELVNLWVYLSTLVDCFEFRIERNRYIEDDKEVSKTIIYDTLNKVLNGILATPVYINDYPIDIFRQDLEQLFY